MHQAALGRTKRFDSRADYQVGGKASLLFDNFWLWLGLYCYSQKIFSSQGSLNSLNSSYSAMTTRSKVAYKEDMDRNVTWKDVRLILPTLLILLFTVLVMVTVIPYAFSSVFRQMEAVRAMEAAGLMHLILIWKTSFENILLTERGLFNPPFALAAMSKVVSVEAVTKASQHLAHGSKNMTQDL